MLWYVAIVAGINLGLGYLWGAYVRPCPRCAKARAMGLSLLSPTSVNEFDHRSQPAMPVAAPLSMPAAGASALQEAATVPEIESEPSLDPTTGLVTRAHAEKLLDKLAAAEVDKSPVTVALVELAPIDWVGQTPDALIDKRLVCGVSNIVRQSLADEHTLAQFTEQQFLLLVPHEDLSQVTRRAEEMRQRVATTEFVADGRSYQTTVTCALAVVSSDQVGPRVFGFLQEALDEAKRYGGNRTFMHDGKSPSPVVPAELPVTPQQLAI
jgi:GGDEF domain-containing protein